jgi:hypothetical protein
MNNIWMYWENAGKPTPEYINLCIQSIDKHKGNSQLNLLNQDSIHQYLPDLRPEWHKLKKAAHKADYIRTRLVYKYGGMWLDCDMVALEDIEPLLNFPDAYDYACQNIGTSIGCFVARPGCELLKRLIDAQDKILNENLSGFQWNGIGNELLKELGKDYPYYQWPKWNLDEISGGKVSKLFSRQESIEENLSGNAVIFHFCNEAIGPLIKKSVKDKQLLTSNMLMSKVFRKALGIEENGRDDFNFLEFCKTTLKKLKG